MRLGCLALVLVALTGSAAQPDPQPGATVPAAAHADAAAGRYKLGRELQHVVPSYDLTTLYAGDDHGNTLTPFDPKTGRPGRTFPVTDPYNLSSPRTVAPPCSPASSPAGSRWSTSPPTPCSG